MKTIEKWDVFEVTAMGKTEGNPIIDYSIQGLFQGEYETINVDGFYYGDGIYKVRFMPSFEGIYTYQVRGTFSDIVLEGTFEVTPVVSKNNHGPMRVLDKTHLAYEDGTPYFSMGTTCYAWVNQSMELQEQTLETLGKSPFNKIRFCVFPKYYDYNKKEPLTHPFERGNGEGLDTWLLEKEDRERFVWPGHEPLVRDTKFNYYRLNTEHFKRFDLRIKQLRDMGIEADIILMHPYDKWGINMMNKECCDSYIKYMVARYGAYRNVWWSLANEYDVMLTKFESDWERYAAIICEKDPYNHLRSIHNCMKFYDHSRPWITHCSAQRVDVYRHIEYTDEYIEKYQKPVVWDEIGYEGNIQHGWGNLTPQEMVRRFWEGFVRGGHVGHGETYLDPNEILWWSHGGVLKGTSPERVTFLLSVLKGLSGKYLEHCKGGFDECVGRTKDGSEKIHYLGINQPAFRDFFWEKGETYEVEVIDTWDMTIIPMGVYSERARISLPQKPYMAIKLKRR